MSVHFDATRGQYAVRWRQDGRNRMKRFKSEANAIAFERSLTGAQPASTAADDLSAMPRARLAELKARLAAADLDTAPAKGGVYPYVTAEGRRWYVKYRHADGSSSSKRGFAVAPSGAAGEAGASPRACGAAR